MRVNYLVPLMLLIGYAGTLGITFWAFQSHHESGISFAKAKSCYDYGDPKQRNACLGKGGNAPASCPSGLTVCGATNSCLSYDACKSAGAAFAEPRDTPKEERNPARFRIPSIRLSPTPIVRASVSPVPSGMPSPLASLVPAEPLSNGKCSDGELFACPCGCFSAQQFVSRGTDKCTDMCGGGRTVPTPVPSVLARVPSLMPSVIVGSPAPSAPYYSQVNNDTPISEDCPKVTFHNVGCGETTTANILTHAGIPTTPEQAAAQTRGGKCEGTTYSQDIAVLERNGFTADQYTGSFKDLPEYMGSDDVLWLSVLPNDSLQGHHTYIDGYTVVDGEPVYNLRDPYYGSEMKCVADGDRAFQCEAYGRQLHINAPSDSDNSGQGTVAVLLTPP